MRILQATCAAAVRGPIYSEPPNTLLIETWRAVEEIHLWKALTAHLSTKTNPEFTQQQQAEVNTLTNRVSENIAPWGEFKRTNEDSLKEIVSKVAQLALALSQLPFRIVPFLDLRPGAPFNPQLMEDPDKRDEDSASKNTTIILTYPWFKTAFDENGEEIWESLNRPLCKAQVSCLQ